MVPNYLIFKLVFCFEPKSYKGNECLYRFVWPHIHQPTYLTLQFCCPQQCSIRMPGTLLPLPIWFQITSFSYQEARIFLVPSLTYLSSFLQLSYLVKLYELEYDALNLQRTLRSIYHIQQCLAFALTSRKESFQTVCL